MNNSTPIINKQDHKLLLTLTWRELYAAKYAFNEPFRLDLSDGSVFYAERVLRLIPKRRMVVFGLWQGRPVFAKLFFSPQKARLNMEKDGAGIKALMFNKIPTPPLIFQGASMDKRIYVSLFERVFNAENLEEIWLRKTNIASLMPLLKHVVYELATQHVLGILQQDLHLKNFMVSGKTIYTLDGAEIAQYPHLLPKKMCLDYLGKFFSQFGVGTEYYQETLFRHYAQARGWLLKPADIDDLFTQIKKWDNQRWRRYLKKTFRTSTIFAPLRTWRLYGTFDRSYGSGQEFMAFLHDPDAVFQHPSAVMLKEGRSATVIKVTLDQKDLVVKRYNLKNSWHRLRRCLRSTRAALSWRIAQKMDLFGVLTAKPVAMIEKRFLKLRGKSYYVTEYVPGMHVGEYLRQQMHSGAATQMVQDVSTLLKNTAKLGITQGDLKVTNILIDEKSRPVLIDLDGAKEHHSQRRLYQHWRKDIQRFLENFKDAPQFHAAFKAVLVDEPSTYQ